MGRTHSRNGKGTLARRADRYDLYQRSVQEPEEDVRFAGRVFQREFGRPAKVLREDFCGTGLNACEWIRSRRDRSAWGIDLDPEPLAWGRAHNLSALPAHARERVHLVRGDVRTARTPPADVLMAFNFSYWVFKSRPELLAYFRAARRHLAREGTFILDIMGGSDTWKEEYTERRREGGFTYLWEHRRIDPIAHDGLFDIHFRLRDGSELRRAFTYDWRIWTIAEVRELLDEAAFRRSDVYWEQVDPKTDKGNGVYTRRERAPADPSWIAFIVGVR